MRCARANCWRESLIAHMPAEYPARIRKAFSTDLEFATRIARRFYRGRFLEEPSQRA